MSVVTFAIEECTLAHPDLGLLHFSTLPASVSDHVAACAGVTLVNSPAKAQRSLLMLHLRLRRRIEYLRAGLGAVARTSLA